MITALITCAHIEEMKSGDFTMARDLMGYTPWAIDRGRSLPAVSSNAMGFIGEMTVLAIGRLREERPVIKR